MDNAVEKPKNKGGRPRKNPVAAPTEAQHENVEAVPQKIAGYYVKDGFSWITIYPLPGEPMNKRYWCGPWQVGDGNPIRVLRGSNVCLPNAIINTIRDSVVETYEDDLSDILHPVRNKVLFTRFPHSDPIPATYAEFKAFQAKQSGLIHPNKAAKK